MIGATGLPWQKIIPVEVKQQKAIDPSLTDPQGSSRIPKIVVGWEIKVEVDIEINRRKIGISFNFIFSTTPSYNQKWDDQFNG